MKKKTKTRREPPAEGKRCLDCEWCRETGRFERGDGFICVKLDRPLTRRKLWGRVCGGFAPLSGLQ